MSSQGKAQASLVCVLLPALPQKALSSPPLISQKGLSLAIPGKV